MGLKTSRSVSCRAGLSNKRSATEPLKWSSRRMSEQKVGIVTGAARPWGMGYQIAMGLARKGLDIAVIDVREDWGAQTVADLKRETGRRAIFVKADITKRADVAVMAERVAADFGRIDALVN